MLLALAVTTARAEWHFTDVTAAAGLTYEHGYVDTSVTGFREPSNVAGGVAAGDYDGDGRVDLYVVRGDIGANLLFRNRGDGTFEERGAAAGVALTGVRSCGPLFADLDGDGWLDLFVGGVDGTPPSLFHNNGDGTFTDVTAASGLLASGPLDTYSAIAGDYDRDGDLDLFLTHWASTNFVPGASSFQLWQNDGHGHFTDVTVPAGIRTTDVGVQFFPFAGNFADIDGDGWPDLLVTGDFGTSRVYLNLRDGTFVDTTDRTVITDQNGMGAAIGDYDGDGDLDWFVSSIWDADGIAESNWGTTGNRLYRNRGDGTFDDTTDAAGVREGDWGWAATFQDLNNDGQLDLFQVNGFGAPGIAQTAQFFADPARLFVGNGDGTFTERAMELGVADTLLGRGVVAFDYDGDGDIDLFIQNNGGPGRLYRNDGGNALHWLDVELRGRAPNVQAIGARVRATVDGRAQLRELRAGTNYVSQDPVVAHFGLGAARRATVEVVWPDGGRSVRDAVASDQRLVLQLPPPGVDEQTRSQRDCIVALNAAGARVAAAAGKNLIACVEAASAGKLPAGLTAHDCLAADRSGRVAAATAQTEAVAAKRCPVAPTFGPASAAAVDAAMVALQRPQDVFGPDLDAALLDARSDRTGAACQIAVMKGMVAVTRAKLEAFNACTHDGLHAGAIRSAGDFAGCAAAMSGPAVSKALARAEKSAAKRCARVDLARALPDRCGTAPLGGLFACLDVDSSCGVCLALHGADGMTTPCHVFTDGVATHYCGDRPSNGQSVARRWDEVLLDAIRRDTPRPTVHARNLFHLSAAMWDAWRAYGGGSAWLTDESHTSADPAADRAAAISFAAYGLLAHRFRSSPGAPATEAELQATMYDLGYDVTYTSTVGDGAAAVGNRIAAAMIAFGAADGANEDGNYADPTYVPVNPPLVVKNPGTVMNDPNRWQPLVLGVTVTQNGIRLLDQLQTFIGARWNGVTPFALTRADPQAVYIDPGPPPALGGVGDADYKGGRAGCSSSPAS
jgi:hypothetical protein